MADRGQALTKAGEPCGATPQRAGQHCFMHDPKRAKDRIAARQKGGRHARGIRDADRVESVPLEGVGDVVRLLSIAAGDLPAAERPTCAGPRLRVGHHPEGVGGG